MPPFALWMVSFNTDGPTGASTSTPARAIHASLSCPRKNSSLRPSHSPSMPIAPGAETRISSGAPATTTVGVSEMAGDWARAAAKAKTDRQRRESQPCVVRRNMESRIVFSIVARLPVRNACYSVVAGRGCAASHAATRSWTSSSSWVVMWVPTICRLAAYLSWLGPLTEAAKSSQK